MDNDTVRTPSQKDAEYERAYAEWLASKTPAEIAELRRLGLDKPSLPHPKSNPHGSAAAINIENRAHPDDWDGGIEDDDDPETFDPETEREPGVLPEPPDTSGLPPDKVREIVSDAIARVVGEILSHPRARMTAECLALVTGTCYTGDSEQEIARRYGVERAAISKRCVELSDKFGLPPSRAMRSLDVREVYSQAQLSRGGVAA